MLNIPKTEDQGAIKRAYYQLAKKYHPDVNNGNDAKFKEVSEAYEVIIVTYQGTIRCNQ